MGNHVAIGTIWLHPSTKCSLRWARRAVAKRNRNGHVAGADFLEFFSKKKNKNELLLLLTTTINYNTPPEIPGNSHTTRPSATMCNTEETDVSEIATMNDSLNSSWLKICLFSFSTLCGSSCWTDAKLWV